MQALTLRLVLAAILFGTVFGATTSALAIEAQVPATEQHVPNAEEETRALSPAPAAPVDRLVWMFVGIVASGILLAAFYAFKRRLGGFPSSPAWVAPITIVPSSTFPDDGSYEDETTERGAGGGHGHHH
jgi:hypothetical protein